MTRPRAYVTALALLAPLATTRVAAQDTSKVNEGVRIGVDYQPGLLPGLVVLPGPSLDSARAIVGRDLDFSDRFKMIVLADVPDGPSSGRGGTETGAASTTGSTRRWVRSSGWS